MRHATLYPPLAGAVSTGSPKVGTPGPKVGTPGPAARRAGKGGKHQPQPGEAVLEDKNAYMTVFVGHTELTVPTVPTFFSENRFLTGRPAHHLGKGLRTRIHARGARHPYGVGDLPAAAGYSGYSGYSPTACRPGDTDCGRGEPCAC